MPRLLYDVLPSTAVDEHSRPQVQSEPGDGGKYSDETQHWGWGGEKNISNLIRNTYKIFYVEGRRRGVRPLISSKQYELQDPLEPLDTTTDGVEVAPNYTTCQAVSEATSAP